MGLKWNGTDYGELVREVAIVSGFFDPLHVGHLRMLAEAKDKYDQVFVLLNSDKQAIAKKGYVFMPYEEREEIMISLVCVDDVIPVIDTDSTVCETIRKIREKQPPFRELFFIKGGDRGKDNTPESKVCEELGIKVVYGIGGTDKPQSSSWLINRVIDMRLEGQIEALKKLHDV